MVNCLSSEKALQWRGLGPAESNARPGICANFDGGPSSIQQVNGLVPIELRREEAAEEGTAGSCSESDIKMARRKLLLLLKPFDVFPVRHSDASRIINSQV